MFLAIGTFAVITVVAGPGDPGHAISPTTGAWPGASPCWPWPSPCSCSARPARPSPPASWPSCGVVEAVGRRARLRRWPPSPWSSAAVAAFFYLRVAVTMYSPVGAVGDPLDGNLPGGGDGGAGASACPSPTGPTGPSRWPASRSSPTTRPRRRRGAWRGPRAAAHPVAVGLCVAVTVVFGIVPGTAARLRPPGHPAAAALITGPVRRAPARWR